MSSARKRGAIQKANNDADQLRQRLILASHHANLFKKVAEILAQDAERYRALRRGQKWSVVDGIGDTLRGDALDAAIDAAAESYNAELNGRGAHPCWMKCYAAMLRKERYETVD